MYTSAPALRSWFWLLFWPRFWCCCQPVAVIMMGALLLAEPASGQDVACADALTTAQMRDCLNRDLQEQEAALVEVIAQLRTLMDEEALHLLDISQAAWHSYRDAECARQADSVRGGSLAGVLYLACRLALTAERRDVMSAELTPP